MSLTSEKLPSGADPRGPESPSRRGALMKIGIFLNALAGVLLGIPIVGYLLSPARRQNMRATLSWVSLGKTDAFPVGATRMATFRSPFTRPWDGATANTACWVRRASAATFQVFAINCVHLGCPVRWFVQSRLFLCPCHGGAYYEDGSRAAGPPERGLFVYQNKVEEGQLWIRAGMMPTLGHVREA